MHIYRVHKPIFSAVGDFYDLIPKWYINNDVKCISNFGGCTLSLFLSLTREIHYHVDNNNNPPLPGVELTNCGTISPSSVQPGR